jgi:hypothetical protein
MHSTSKLATVRARSRATVVALATLAAGALTLYACGDRANDTASSAPTIASADLALAPGVHVQYGEPVRVGDGRARTYVVLDEKTGRTPLEIGVALDERALDGLPAPMPTNMIMAKSDAGPHDHSGSTIFNLQLPQRHGTPYQFVELDWNPGGHEPAGVYDVPHFDFHFYTITREQRDAIDPVQLGDSAYLAKSGALPPQNQAAPNYIPLGAPGAPLSAVPHMGVHWADLRSQELQGMFGHPELDRPFTTTFLHGSWDGQFIFDEPMITRAFILGRKTVPELAQRDTVMPLARPAAARIAGLYPSAYRVTWDAQDREYHIALTALAKIE